MLHSFNYHVFGNIPCSQDEEPTYLTNDHRGAAAISSNLEPVESPMNGNDSADENDVDEDTISGENDVEYAEFSMSLQMSPKEGPVASSNGQQHELRDDDVVEDVSILNRIDDDFMLLAEISDSGSSSSAAARKLIP